MLENLKGGYRFGCGGWANGWEVKSTRRVRGHLAGGRERLRWQSLPFQAQAEDFGLCSPLRLCASAAGETTVRGPAAQACRRRTLWLPLPLGLAQPPPPPSRGASRCANNPRLPPGRGHNRTLPQEVRTRGADQGCIRGGGGAFGPMLARQDSPNGKFPFSHYGHFGLEEREGGSRGGIPLLLRCTAILMLPWAGPGSILQGYGPHLQPHRCLSAMDGRKWGGGIPCLTNLKSTNSGARKPVPFLKNERTNYMWFPKIGHEFSLTKSSGMVHKGKGTA